MQPARNKLFFLNKGLFCSDMSRAFLMAVPVSAFLTVAGVYFSSCGGGGQAETEEAGIADSTIELAKTMCSSCHDFVPPELLDRKTWTESVLPWMAPKMGIYELDGRPLRSEKSDPDADPSLYPDKPLLSHARYKEIMAYFEKTAPEQLPLQARTKQIGPPTGRFRNAFPELPPTEAPLTTFVKILPASQKVVVGVAGEYNRLGYFEKDLKPLWVTGLPSAPAWVDFSGGNEWLVTCMGSVMPSNKKEGRLMRLQVNGKQAPDMPREILSGLPRPVQITVADMDGNGSGDYLVNGFGHLSGMLFWQKPGSNERKVLRDYPGAIHSEMIDWDGDGKKDILTMFTQNREGIYLFKNKGNGSYEEKKLIGFLPVYGSSSFSITDINGDGKKDIVYTCGDNADYSVVLKPFHGVYLYINKGNDQFEQAWFYPVHGCYKALVKDFDLDGDLDVFTISFFADYLTQPKEAVIYFENNGNLDFTPYSVPGFDRGRWLTCDAGDLDGDGDEDIVLGNFSMGPESFMSPDMPAKFAAEPVFMYLENTTR